MENMDQIILNLIIMYVIVVIMYVLMHFQIFYDIFIIFYLFMQNYPIIHHLLYLGITNLIMMEILACIMEQDGEIMGHHHLGHLSVNCIISMYWLMGY
jgi:hypothetical protein